MSKVILVLGGARSGKSRHAAGIAEGINGRTVFIATATASDEEMKERIRLHKISRPKSWDLIEEPLDLNAVLCRLKSTYDAALVDCMGLWVTNLMMAGTEDRVISEKVAEFANGILKAEAAFFIIVSNDVGSGIVPGDLLSRRFRDLLGEANQALAKKADEVIFMHAGIPMIIKERR